MRAHCEPCLPLPLVQVAETAERVAEKVAAKGNVLLGGMGGVFSKVRPPARPLHRGSGSGSGRAAAPADRLGMVPAAAAAASRTTYAVPYHGCVRLCVRVCVCARMLARAPFLWCARLARWRDGHGTRGA